MTSKGYIDCRQFWSSKKHLSEITSLHVSTEEQYESLDRTRYSNQNLPTVEQAILSTGPPATSIMTELIV